MNPDFSSPSSRTWQFAVGALLVALLVALGVFRHAAVFLIAAWRTNTYSHGFLILPISLYLVWMRRRRLEGLQPSPCAWGLVALLACVVAWFLADLVDVRSVQEMAFVLALISVVWAVLGSKVVLALRLPLAFLLFAVPLGDGLIPPLQDFTAEFAISALHATGIPALLQGRVIAVPSGLWEVAAACSGLRFLIASVALGFLFAGLVYRSWTRRIIFLVASVVVPIIANGLRVYGIILLGHLSNNRLAAGIDHLVYGWLFSSLVGFALFAIGWRWREMDNIDPPPTEAPAPGRAREMEPGARKLAPRIIAAAVFCVALLVAGPLTSHALSERQISSAAPVLSAPSPTPPWAIREHDNPPWNTESSDATSQLKAAYSSGSREAWLLVDYFAPSELGTDVINAKPALYDESRWIRLSGGSTRAIVGGKPLMVNATVINSRAGSLLLWSWYCVNSEFTANGYREKIREARARLQGRRQGSALIVLAAEFSSDDAQAAVVLQDFLDHTALRTDLLPLCQ